ncbi:MAG: hypothetical protein SGPRY_007881, partial [Prymnesium sp.]
FSEKPTGTPRSDWPRIAVLENMFAVEEIGASPDPRKYISQLEEETWIECLRYGEVECVRCFSADPQCVIAVRFAEERAASECVRAMEGRWFNERRVVAGKYDGHKKRMLPAECDGERQARLRAAAQPSQPSPPVKQQAAPSSARESRWGGAVDTSNAAAAAEMTAVQGPLSLPVQTYVKMYGLRSAAERNGQIGLLGELDAGSGRYTVTLRDGTALALKPGNLLQMLEVTVEAGGGEELSEAELAHNGAKGTIFEYDEASHMYGVELSSGEAIPLPVGSVRLPDGAVGTVVGLQGAAQYNGTLARVLSHDDTSGRYLVTLDGEKQLKLKRGNLRV